MEETNQNDFIRSTLKKNVVFNSFSDTELDLIVAKIEKKTFQPNEWIIREGEINTFLVLIVDGEVGVYKSISTSKKPILIRKLGSNKILGELSCLRDAPRAASVLALKQTIAFVIHLEQIDVSLLYKLKIQLIKYSSESLVQTDSLYVRILQKKTRLFIAIIFIIALSFAVAFFISGYLPDREAERVVEQLYQRDKNGVIIGSETIARFKGNTTLVFFLHGFMESPAAFSSVIHGLEEMNLSADYYAPLAPFHGRSLQDSSRFDIQILLQFFKDQINEFSKKYAKVILVGYSFGGAVLIELDKQRSIPENCGLILYAPGVFIKTNTIWNRIQFFAFSLWRNYCNYDTFGCSYPVYESGDVEAKNMIEEEKNLRFRIASAALELYKLDRMSRDHLAEIHRPYALIVAEDDNRVSFEKLKEACDQDAQFCTFYPFSSGRHLIHWGNNKRQFIDLLAKLIVQYEQTGQFNYAEDIGGISPRKLD